jgi:hypothetical protein
VEGDHIQWLGWEDEEKTSKRIYSEQKILPHTDGTPTHQISTAHSI